MLDTVESLVDAAWKRGLAPDPILTVDDWANRHRMLSSVASAEPGRWSTSRTPYLKAVMETLSATSRVERVVLMAGAQIGKTEAGLNWLGYVIHHAPGPMLLVQPTVEGAKRVSKQRVDALIEASPELAGRVKDPRSRDSGNTQLMKEFPGGVLIMTGANSAVGLRSMPVRYLFLDEVDGYPGDADGEGDPVALAVQRAATFVNRKVYLCSTPTLKGYSRIEAAYLESDQRVFEVPCDHCGAHNQIQWRDIRWPKDKMADAAWHCPQCDGIHPEYRKPALLASGRWTAKAEGDGSMVVTINRPPLAQVLDIKVTQAKTETVIHGAFTGSRDVLTEPTVVAVLTIKQGTTIYAQGTDYKVVGDEIDWSPGGGEPAPGSSYQVTYQFIASITPTHLTDTGFKVTGVVQGSTMYIDYQWKLPRIDVLALTADGQVERIKGISQVRNPVAPTVPASRLALAEIAYDWRSGSTPGVRNVAIRTIKVSELTAMQRQIADLYDLMALERLRVDANIREPAAKKGLFVDNFLDDDLRDQGVAQTGAVVAGVLTLPITASSQHAKDNGNALITLDYTLTPVIEQLARTGAMKINPYQAFEPVPARVTLNPAVDQFTVTNTTWASDVTERLITGSGVLEQVVETRRSEQVLASSSEEAQFLRSLNVAYRVEGFGPSEALSALRFDGIGISQPVGTSANASGLLTGSFQIPQAIPAGAKLVEFLGAGGSYGSATYVGRGQIVTETRRRILTTVVRRWDPLAQTFTLPERRTIGGLELWFTTKGGAAPVIVQIRETQVGMPTTTVLTEGRLLASDIKTDGNPTRIALDPVALEANREYAIVVLTDDANHAVSVAELGKYDPRTGWVTAQPYQIGVLLSSSNGITWTPHQTQDLTFRLLGCRFTQQSKTVSLGQYTVTNLSDVMTLAGVERPAAGTDVQFLATDAQGRIYTLSEDRGLALSEKLSGNLAVSAKLTGTETASPILYPGTQLVFGTLEAAGDYLSRAIPAAATFNVAVTFDALTPGTSSVSVQAESGTSGSFQPLSLSSGVEVGNGWVERTYKATSLVGVGADRTTRVKLALSGNPQHRPFVRNLRVIVT